MALFAVVIFCRQYFPNDILYWATYFVMFVFVALYWYVSFWVSEKSAVKVLGKKPAFDIFCGKVPPRTEDDLQRGRLCVCDGFLVLVYKQNGKKYIKLIEIPVSDISSVGYGIVAGKRKGFTVYYGNNKEVSFTSSAIFKRKQELYNALEWDFSEEEK